MRAPSSAASPQGELKAKIDKAFGSLDEFKKTFEKQGVTLFGSGWVWLALDEKGELKIVQTKDAENPIRQNMTPLFHL